VGLRSLLMWQCGDPFVGSLKNCGNHIKTSSDQASCYLTRTLEADTLSLSN
jgi:hypothetical protein